MNSPKIQNIRIEMESFSIKSGLYHTWVNLSLFLLYLIITAGVLKYFDLFEYAKYSIYSSVYFGSLVFVLFLKFIIYLIKNDIAHGYIFNKSQTIKDLKSNWLNWEYLIVIFIPFMTVLLLMSMFGSMKTLLFTINPFYLDEVFMKIDRFLHFGFQPWELTHMLFGSPLLTRGIDLIYQSWFILFRGFTMWMIVSHKLGAL